MFVILFIIERLIADQSTILQESRPPSRIMRLDEWVQSPPRRVVFCWRREEVANRVEWRKKERRIFGAREWWDPFERCWLRGKDSIYGSLRIVQFILLVCSNLRQVSSPLHLNKIKPRSELKSCPHFVPGNQCLSQHKMALCSHLEYSMWLCT